MAPSGPSSAKVGGEVNEEKKKVSLYSVAAGAGLTCLKIVIALSIGSLAMLAESAHSALDLAAALMTFIAVRVSARPADRTHNFGHGKVENLSALIEIFLLAVTVVWVVYEAVQRLFVRSVEVDASAWAFAVMGVSIAVDYARSRALSGAARKHRSQALEADALNYRNDMLSSTVTIVGLLLVRVSQSVPSVHFLQHADSVAALGLVVVITAVSARLGKQAVNMLLDRAPDIPTDHVVRSVKAIPGIIDCHNLRVRQSGPDTFVDVHVTMDPRKPLGEVHQLMGQVQETVRALVPGADVAVHPEPAGERHPSPYSETAGPHTEAG